MTWRLLQPDPHGIGNGIRCRVTVYLGIVSRLLGNGTRPSGDCDRETLAIAPQ